MDCVVIDPEHEFTFDVSEVPFGQWVTLAVANDTDLATIGFDLEREHCAV